MNHVTFVRSLVVLTLVVGCSSDGAPGSDAGSGGAGGSSAGQGTGGGAGVSSAAGNAGSAVTMAGAAGTLGNGGAAGSASAGAGGGGSGASGGGGGAGTPTACTGKTYKLCEDFESGTLGGLPKDWTKFKGYGDGSPTDVVLSDEQTHTGKQSLKSSSLAKGQTRAQHSLAALGATASKHWGRIFYRVESPAVKPDSGVFHVTFTGLMGTGENRVVDIVEDSQGMHQWLYNNPDDNGGKATAYDWKFDDAWHCAEWYVDVGAKAYRFFHDSKEVTELAFTGKNDAQMSNYDAVIVGAEFYQVPPKAFVVWFDDLAIDDAQIGCQ